MKTRLPLMAVQSARDSVALWRLLLTTLVGSTEARRPETVAVAPNKQGQFLHFPTKNRCLTLTIF
ncbi:MAG: hypothetical protein ACFB4I_17910 [Cyanophyceae cyanobacterium]